MNRLMISLIMAGLVLAGGISQADTLIGDWTYATTAPTGLNDVSGNGNDPVENGSAWCASADGGYAWTGYESNYTNYGLGTDKMIDDTFASGNFDLYVKFAITNAGPITISKGGLEFRVNTNWNSTCWVGVYANSSNVMNGGTTLASASGTPTSSDWHEVNIVSTVDGDTANVLLYLDGALVDNYNTTLELLQTAVTGYDFIVARQATGGAANGYVDAMSLTAVEVPEPATVGLLLAGGVAAMIRRKK